MNKLIVVFFTLIVSPCFSQVEEFFDEFKGTSVDMYQRLDSIQQIPKETLVSLRKRLPNKRKMPLLSSSEYMTSVKHIKGFIRKHRTRIFQSAFRYNNYLIVDYYINVNTYTVRVRAVAKLNNKKQVDMIILMKQADVSDRKNFGRFKRIGKKIYQEEQQAGDETY